MIKSNSRVQDYNSNVQVLATQKSRFASPYIIVFVIVTLVMLVIIMLPQGYATMRTINMTRFTDRSTGTIQVFSNDSALVMCYGNASSTNRNIATINASFFGPSSNNNSAASAGTSYKNATCQFTAARTVAFNCTTVIHHHSEPGMWNCTVMAGDGQNTISNSTNNTVDTLMSIAITSTKVNFSKISLGSNSGTTDTRLIFNNTGNVPFRIQMDAYRSSGVTADANCMSCTVGTIPVGSLRYAESAGVAATSKTALTDAAITTTTAYNDTAFNATAYTNGTLYYGLVMGTTTAQGACTGFLGITAVP